MSISTGKGDGGETDLIGGPRVPKDDPRLEATGTVDELNAAIGLTRSASAPEPIATELATISDQLFRLGTDLSTPGPDRARARKPLLGLTATKQLDQWIAREEKTLPRLRRFILPGGCAAAAALHHARTICRRAERRVVSLYRATDEASDAVVFLNRLSDLLFLYARRANLEAGIPDVEWISE